MKVPAQFEIECYQLLQDLYRDKFVLSVACASAVSHIATNQFPSIPIKASDKIFNYTQERLLPNGKFWAHQIDYSIIKKEDIKRIYYFNTLYDFENGENINDFIEKIKRQKRVLWVIFDECVPKKVEESFLVPATANKGMVILKKGSRPECVIDAKYQYSKTKKKYISNKAVNKLVADAEMMAASKACIITPHYSDILSPRNVVLENKYIMLNGSKLGIKILELIGYKKPDIITRDEFNREYFNKFQKMLSKLTN